MQPISFILCNYNTPEYFKFGYNSLRKNLSSKHEIVLLDDGSEDDCSRNWMRQLDDPGVVRIENPENVGIAYSYNTAMDAATNDMVCVLHSDMYVPPGFDQAMLRGMENHDFICSFRAEPDMYPPSPDKAVADFGHDPETFDEAGFLAWNAENARENSGKTRDSIFFPWMTRREFFTSIGGVDLLFLKYMVDDDDLYLRAKLAGARMCQIRDAAVYHFGSRSTANHDGALLKAQPGGAAAQPSQSWKAQYARSQRNFVRKWGRHSSSFWTGSMAIRPQRKYDLGIVARGATLEQVHALEPWASNIYVDDAQVRKAYLAAESSNTMFNLAQRVRLLERAEPHNMVMLELDPAANNIVALEQGVPTLLDKAPAPGTYDLGNGMRLVVRDLTTSERDQVVNTRRFAYKKGLSEREFFRTTA